MFIFRFIKFIKFRKTCQTDEWIDAYNYLCDNSDFLYLREKELKSYKKTLLGFLAYCVCLWIVSLSPLFSSWWMIVLSVIFTLFLLIYSLSVFCYVPMEIEVSRISAKKEATRRPSSVVSKKIRQHGVELLHHYYLYKTFSGKTAIDMTDRILGFDQNYDLEELVFCFSGINNDLYYILPILKEEKETENVDDDTM